MSDIINDFNKKIDEIVNKNVEIKINNIKNKISKKIIEMYKNKNNKIKINDILKLFDEFNEVNIQILYDDDLEVYKFKECRTFYVLENDKPLNNNNIIGKIKNNEIINLTNADILKCKKNNWKYIIKNDESESESE